MYLYVADYPEYGWFPFTIERGPVYHATVQGDTVTGSRIRKDQATGYPVYYEYTP